MRSQIISNTNPPPLSLSPIQSALRSVDGERAQRMATAATLSVWAAAQSLEATQHAPRACITTTKGAAWPTALPAPTNLRAGAASAPSSAHKSTSPNSTASSSTAMSACPSARLGTRALRPTGELPSVPSLAVTEPQGGAALIVGPTLVPAPRPAISFHSEVSSGWEVSVIQQPQ